jgi:hypothetical protein
MREKSPPLEALDRLAEEAARQFHIDDAVVNLLVTPHTLDVVLRLRELLLGGFVAELLPEA